MKSLSIGSRLVVAAGAVVLVAAACSSGVDQKEYDDVKAQLTAKEQQATTLQNEVNSLKQQVTAKTNEANTLATQVAGSGDAAAPKGLIVAAISATPAVRPTATPGPSPTPRPLPPTEIRPIAVWADTATASTSSLNVAATKSCLRVGDFKRGMKVLWRAEFIDTSTGKVLQGPEIESAVIKVPSGQEIKMKYGPHGNPATFFWTGSYEVPFDHPFGAFNYSITVKSVSGKAYTYQEMPITTVNIIE